MASDILCRCKKCGREFVGLPLLWPAFDRYYPANKPALRSSDPPTDEQCGGELELTEAGKKELVERQEEHPK
jgi:hypothetical protein